MRILHTADWHLGLRLGARDLTGALLDRVEIVAQLCDEHQVDVLLIAGDVFEKRYGLSQVTRRLAQILGPRVQKGLSVVMTSGNHDDREHFRMMRALMGLDRSQALAERVHIVENAEIFSLNGVHFGVMPYPSHDLILLPNDAEISDEMREQFAGATYGEQVKTVGQILEERAEKAGENAVFVVHITVAGVVTPSDHEINYNESLLLGREDLPENVAYIALGHIHQMQQIPTKAPCLYSGSLDRLNMGEWKDQKYVLLVEVPEKGAATWQTIELEPTPFRKLKLRGEDLDELAAQTDLSGAFVTAEIECDAGDDPIAVRRQLNAICPNLLDVQMTGEGVVPRGASDLAQPRDVVATALAYVRARHEGDADLPELERAAKSLLAQVTGAPVT